MGGQPKKKTAAKKTATKKKKTAAKKTATKKKKTAAKKTATRTSGAMSASERIDRKLAELDDWRGERLAEIRQLIHEVDPEVVEEWKWMGSPVWSHGGMYLVGNAHKDKVKLTFVHGAQLSDPGKVFNAGLGGNKWRAVDIHEHDAIDRSALGALLREAVAYNTGQAASRRKAPKERTSSKAGPKLLSGDNPQIAKADGDAPVQAYIAAIPGWKREVARRLDELIASTVPGVRKAVKWNSPFYGVEGHGWFLSFHCFTKYVKVTFFRGTSLSPVPPGTSKHEEVRYLDVREHDPFDEELVTGWIRQASELPGWRPSGGS